MSFDLDSATKHLLNLSKGLLGVLAGMLAFLVVVLPFLLIRGCDQDPGTNDARRLERLTTLEDVLKQEEQLVSVEYIDQENGVVHLPIDNAMAVAIDKLKNKQVTNTGTKAEWAPPQLPDWAKSEPLYTLARPAEDEKPAADESAEPAEEGEQATNADTEPATDAAPTDPETGTETPPDAPAPETEQAEDAPETND